MKLAIIEVNGFEIAVVQDEEVLILDVQTALDLMATIEYQTGCNRIIIDKTALTEEFFDPSTCLAGEILQKFVNYDKKLAVVGSFSAYKSKALKDFIYESNKGRNFLFVSTVEEAAQKLSQ